MQTERPGEYILCMCGGDLKLRELTAKEQSGATKKRVSQEDAAKRAKMSRIEALLKQVA